MLLIICAFIACLPATAYRRVTPTGDTLSAFLEHPRPDQDWYQKARHMARFRTDQERAFKKCDKLLPKSLSSGFEVVLYRAHGRRKGGQSVCDEYEDDLILSNRNAGNFKAELKWLRDFQEQYRNGKLERETLACLSAYRVQIDPGSLSEYFHCEGGKCVWRMTCFEFKPGMAMPQAGLCEDSIHAQNPSFDRVGIKMGTSNMQVSRCYERKDPYENGHVCWEDECVADEERRSQMIRRCAGNDGKSHDCFFAFGDMGRSQSYKVLKRVTTKSFSLGQNLEEQLQQLYNAVRSGK
uniref:Uncharacterized protein n=1 Tax=Chromera velia CCMP2878 TaxID=1169474 RepID=A0A0G4HW27_9ALVE|eukprot:Cvel_8956.t1-p1 / transcript=Cvel_8956.t1 / gene=Cvel_8956 / organism=Chromera_velia_CCMP2878 / gene_product=hypothetical protein / transcript_product=hypothetical protein / location=Cvel_scaffold505:9642-10523(-) / protein_length=294 / sequence_SO=supercontig / SO=protein_coding / is_pseudo=false